MRWNAASLAAASACVINFSTQMGTSMAVTAASACSLAMRSAVLPSTHPHQAKPRIIIPNAPTTTPQHAGFNHGGTFMRHLLHLIRALRSTMLLKTCDMIAYVNPEYDG